ncbi:insulinase family protein [Pedobacter sp. SAFR-022]|uniref:insulinase family protein n=1 Tax=Pedobacter sp. SAFR-022 TaxID=3436861 RepID=UPI003F7FD7C6
MKKIFILALTGLFAHSVMAQKLDRSQKPKPGPAPTITFADPAIYKLPNGITVLVVENHKLPKVTATYSIDAGPITEGAKAGVMSLMGGMLSEGTTKKTKAQFDEAIDLMGADVNVSSSGGSASSLTRYFNDTFMLMAEALRNPSFPQESFDKLKSQTLTGIKSNERSAKAISGRVVNALSYGVNHPIGEFVSEQSVNSITLDDVKAAYSKYVTPSRGYLTFVGDITPAAARALATKAFGDWKGASLTLPKLAPVSNPNQTEINLIDVPTAVQAEITVTNLVDLPLSSPDYHAVLLADQILGGGADAKLFTNLREKHGFTYGAYSSTGSGRFQAKFSASAAVRNEKVDSAVVEFLREINIMRTEKVSAEDLQNAKNLYNGTFALGLENPARMASFALNIMINDLPKDFYRTYLKKINAVTQEDVLRVSQKYFGHDNARIVVVGKQEDILPGLKKLGYALKLYDKYANPVNEAVVAAVPKKTPAEVISSYINAIGGEAELKKVNTIVSTGDFEVQGQRLNASSKQMAPNLESTVIAMGGTTVMKDVFDGTTGTKVQGPSTISYTPEELKEKKTKKGMFEQLYYTAAQLEDGGISKVGDVPAYKINVTPAAGSKKTEYYDAKTGLLIKEERVVKGAGKDLAITMIYSEYKKAGNVLMPYRVVQIVPMGDATQEMTIVIKDVKINTPLTAADFK